MQSFPPTLCLDGVAVRRIREEKKLTQLYVAKVVGVTTDTISRWENNRYPSVKRENVLRLAEALEVSVEELLRREGGEVSEAEKAEEPQAVAPRRNLLHRFFPLILVLFVLGAIYFTLRPRGEVPGPVFLAERLLPSYAAPGSVIPVQVRLQAAQEKKGFILREHFPKGWKLIEASPPASSFDNETGTARWIVKSGEQHRQIAYLLRVGEDARLGAGGKFGGEVIASPEGRKSSFAVTGAKKVQVAPHQWADINGDNLIDDGEILAAYDKIDEMPGVHLDWEILDDIWDAGGYRWEEEGRRFVPVSSPSP